ncbi:MAG TPA: hypothetical protein VGW74_05470 [Propionibacteriaceae bacterium]|nr:hypothetical protein [Propionibacteriaceae bacterium]
MKNEADTTDTPSPLEGLTPRGRDQYMAGFAAKREGRPLPSDAKRLERMGYEDGAAR